MLDFKHVAMMAPDVVVEVLAVGLDRFYEAATPNRPIVPIHFRGCADRVCARIRRVVPRAVGDERPLQELGARVVAVAALFKQIGLRDLAERDDEAASIVVAGNLIESIVDVELFAPEIDRLPQESPGPISPHDDSAVLLKLAVLNACKPEQAGERQALDCFRIGVELGSLPKACSEICRRRDA